MSDEKTFEIRYMCRENVGRDNLTAQLRRVSCPYMQGRCMAVNFFSCKDHDQMWKDVIWRAEGCCNDWQGSALTFLQSSGVAAPWTILTAQARGTSRTVATDRCKVRTRFATPAAPRKTAQTLIACA